MENVHRHSRSPELLAPAGGPEALRAAVNNGADAVYLGVESLNARRGAANFTLAALPDAVRYAHVRGARVYLTANVVIRPAEMAEALDLVDEAWAAGVDAVIVQDLGLARVLRTALPDVRLHASTQINAHDSRTIAELARVGFARVTLAREVALGEVAALTATATPELEVFAHGALCMSYSGQCLLSSVIGGRSANRGLCAQPCRLPYELLDEKGGALPAPGRYLLSPRDLSTIDLLPQVVASGVAAIKIEGRMKSPEYVAVVTKTYRAALDRALTDPDGYEATDAERSALAEVFSRGFTTGHLGGERGEDLMAYTRPNNRGVALGRVASARGGTATIALERALDVGDVLEFWTGRGRFAQTVQQMTLKGRAVSSAPAGERVEVPVERAVAGGDRVFRVVSASLEAAARRTFATADAGRTVPARIEVRARIGDSLCVAMQARGERGEACGPVVEPARTKELTASDIMEHVGRLGGTPFLAEEWEIELGPGAGAGFSTVHAVRREAVGALEAALDSPWADRAARHPAVPVPRPGAPREHASDMPEIVVWTTRLATAKACMAAGAHRAIVPAWVVEDSDQLPDGIALELPRIAHEGEVDETLGRVRPDTPYVAGTLGALAASSAASSEVWAHWSLNTVNPWTAAHLLDMGAAGVWVSPEVSGNEVARIVGDTGAHCGMAVLGRQEVMVLEHCLISGSARCDRACATCARRERWYALRDRKGYGMPVIVDPSGRSHVFNAVPVDLTRALDEVVAAGVSAVRFDVTVEHLQQAQKLTRRLREALEAVIAGKSTRSEALLDPATAGHFYRGVG